MRFAHTLPQEIAAHLSLIAGSRIETPLFEVPYRHRPRRVHASLERLGRFLEQWYEDGWGGALRLPDVETAADIAAGLLALHLRSPTCASPHRESAAHLRRCISCKEHLCALLATVVMDLHWTNAGPKQDVFRHYLANHVKCIRIDCDKESIPVTAETPLQREIALQAVRDMQSMPFFVHQLSKDLLETRMLIGRPLTVKEYQIIVDGNVNELVLRMQVSSPGEKNLVH